MHFERPGKDIDEPPEEAPNTDIEPGKYEKWKNKGSLYDKRIDTLEDNQVKLYNLLLGQCIPRL